MAEKSYSSLMFYNMSMPFYTFVYWIRSKGQFRPL